MDSIYYSLFFAFGLIFGSFLNVIIFRIPKNLSIIMPHSFCPKCNKTIPLYRNIPLITYFIQKGNCDNCHKHISIIYPLIEALIGLVWIFGAYYFTDIPEIIYFNIISSLLIAIAIIDIKHFIIPLELTISILSIILIYLLILGDISANIDGIIYGLGYLSIIFIITKIITKRQSLGYGDLQLIFILGFWIADIRILIVIFISALAALIVWLSISFFKGFDKNRPLPFGTFLSITSIIIYPINMDFLLL